MPLWSRSGSCKAGPASTTNALKTRDVRVFKHAPLQGPKDIRLLRIRQGTFSKQLKCKFSHVSLDAKTPLKYLAISYTWGDPTPKHEILCDDGQVMLLTETLHSLLHHPYLMKSDLPVWIDALCIDQDNLIEKSQQVGMMRSIYENAIRVIVYLGEPDGDSDRAMTTFETKASTFHTLDMLGNTTGSRDAVASFFERADSLILMNGIGRKSGGFFVGHGSNVYGLYKK
jgi:hypothetical protein